MIFLDVDMISLDIILLCGIRCTFEYNDASEFFAFMKQVSCS